MEHQTQRWVKVAELSEVTEGKPKAIQMGEGRSIALFNVDGKIYATDNQCPHMGYPLVRGRVRKGVLSCDWHGGQRIFVEMLETILLSKLPIALRGVKRRRNSMNSTNLLV